MSKTELTVAALLGRISEQSGYATWRNDGTEEGEERWESLQGCARSHALRRFSAGSAADGFPGGGRLMSDQDELAEQDERYFVDRAYC
jgi:hypothetical protein